ncbi:hypothetical protein NDU88_008719 [Pleurodeles waltl]|uniref:Uncharacterized protein n=1 Tax=Pleurodeles waltl TaxID=8319 RepID=A0AAV7PQ99_PLEWA|nr:hypothetical protein NDU88_008719 [Pleurodeles waltl]
MWLLRHSLQPAGFVTEARSTCSDFSRPAGYKTPLIVLDFPKETCDFAQLLSRVSNEVLDYSVANREKPYFILGRYA